MSSILVLHGPNLNMLGVREPASYGTDTLADIEQAMAALVATSPLSQHNLTHFQSNAEAELVDRVQQAYANTDFIIINPAALTHTSIALRDALLAVAIPFIEVHLSNVNSREAFRQQSYFSDIARGVITGLGPLGYTLALRAALEILDPTAPSQRQP